MGGVLLTKLWVIALYKAFLQLWHTFMYVSFFCSFFSHFLSHVSRPTSYPVFVCNTSYTERTVVVLSMLLRCWYIWGTRGEWMIYYIGFITKLKVCTFFFFNRLLQYYDGKVREVIIGLCWGDKEYTECRAGPSLWKTIHNNPPVRSSQFPGPSVYVWGAITHQVPLLPLSAFCFLWRSPLPYSCCLRSFPLQWLDCKGEWGKRMKEKRHRKQLGWGGKLVCYETE